MNNHHQVEILATRSRKVWYLEPHRGAVLSFSNMIPDARDLIPQCHIPTTKVVQNGLTGVTLAPLLPAHINIIIPSHYRRRNRDIQAMDLTFVALLCLRLHHHGQKRSLTSQTSQTRLLFLRAIHPAAIDQRIVTGRRDLEEI